MNYFLIDYENIRCQEIQGYQEVNGSLMRILPVCLYLYNRQKVICTSEDESIYIIHNVSALTHAHLRSQMACGFYYFMVKAVLSKEEKLISRLQKGIDEAYNYYRQIVIDSIEFKILFPAPFDSFRQCIPGTTGPEDELVAISFPFLEIGDQGFVWLAEFRPVAVAERSIKIHSDGLEV